MPIAVAAAGGAAGPRGAAAKLSFASASANVAQPSRSKTAPRVAKGVTAMRAAVDMRDLPMKKGPMRYRVCANMPWRHKLWMTLDDPTFVNEESEYWFARRAARHVALLSVLLIVVSTVAMVLEDDMNCTPKSGSDDPRLMYGYTFVTAANCAQWESTWRTIELIAVICFSVELLLRWFAAPDRCRFFRLGYTWIDVLAVVPFYVERVVLAAGAGSDAVQFFKMLRIFRLARVFKLLRMGSITRQLLLVYNTAGSALQDSAQLLVSIFMVTIISMIVFSAAMHQFEPGSDPNASCETSYCPAAWYVSTTRTFWWSLVTITGVGYGDEWPSQANGQAVAVVTAIVGVIIVCVPIEVIGRYFTSHFTRITYVHVLERYLEDRKGVLQLGKMLSFMRELAVKGVLKVKAPQTIDELEELVAKYDCKGNLQLEHEEWSNLIADCVNDRGDHAASSVRKVVLDIAEVKERLEAAKADLLALMERRQEQAQALMALLKEKHPDGMGTVKVGTGKYGSPGYAATLSPGSTRR